MVKNVNASFKIRVKGVLDFDEQCRIQCALQDLIYKLGYNANSSNFKVEYEI